MLQLKTSLDSKLALIENTLLTLYWMNPELRKLTMAEISILAFLMDKQISYLEKPSIVPLEDYLQLQKVKQEAAAYAGLTYNSFSNSLSKMRKLNFIDANNVVIHKFIKLPFHKNKIEIKICLDLTS